MSGNRLKGIEQETLNVVKTGYYDIDGSKVFIKPFESGKLYTPESIEAIDLAACQPTKILR